MKAYITAAVIVGSLLAAPAQAGWFDKLTSNPQTQADTATNTQTATQNSELVGTVMSQLGLTQTQAEGGLGSLLGLAKTSLGQESFSPIADSIPGIDGLLAAAPKLDGTSGMTGLLSKAGDLGNSLQGSAMVYDAFAKLGISKELAAPMIDIVKNYLQSSGGEGTADLLVKGLGSLL
ncbi:DUF2780 domain-containing protein [Shewanella algae]|uniref:DUF2780 domain-containing protein n=1 Tax=Shewanella algae TaxID=38313 RepID=UPI001182E9DA|nr:DUF2780 domain-containing protein [Shewanella algae]MBO2689850.1 DUF2780 domain-containing protein [Shewanella algae]TVK93653.1 hypothetical protein AYJ01_11160 [Shewanella algae]